MRIELGLRLRAAFTLALACLVVVGAIGFTLFTASEDLEDSLLSQLVSEEMDFLVKRHKENPAYLPQPSSNLQGYVVRDVQDHARLPDYLRKLGPGRHALLVGNDEFHVLLREENGTRYYVAYEVGLYEQREQEFKLLVVLSVLTAALVSLALGYWLSGMLLQQLTDLSRQVSKLKPGESREALAQPGQDAEVAMLAGAFDDYQARIEQMIRREQEFTANVSHELRTPLTAIRTSCELLLADPALVEKSRARVVQVNDAAGRMAEQLQALLFLARAQALGGIEPVAIADCVAEALEPYRGEIARKGLTLEVDVAREAALPLNYQALRLVLSNLVRNAVHYTTRGFVRIGYTAKRLTVADSGLGISGEHLPRVFERFFRAEDLAGGAGLGLAIVKRICDQYGWKIELESVPAKGSVFSIVFP